MSRESRIAEALAQPQMNVDERGYRISLDLDLATLTVEDVPDGLA